MSLINQMLRDLESRRTPELPNATITTPRHHQGAKRRWLVLLLLILVVLLAGALGYTVWQQQNNAYTTTTPEAAIAAPEITKQESEKKSAERPRAKTTVVTPQQTKPSRKAVTAAVKPAHLTAIEPSVVDGGWTPRTLLLWGDGLQSGLRVVVSWGDREKQLAAERIEWLDEKRARITLVTGNRDEVWQVALVMPDGSRSEPVAFEVVATASEEKGQQESATTTPARMEKRVRPVSDQQLAERLYQQGYAALQQGDASAAEREWRKALQQAPQHLASREGLIALYLSQGRKIEAAKLLQQGLAQQPQNGKLAMLYARLLAEQGRTAEAITILERAAQSDAPAELYATSAALYQQQRNFDKSIASYQQALKLQPQQATWWMGLGISLEGAGREADAIAAYNESLQRGGLGSDSRNYVRERLRQLD